MSILSFGVHTKVWSSYLVGYPADGGHFLWPHFGYLVVNTDSEHKEEIRDYIAFLLDQDRQLFSYYGMGFSIRWDVIKDSIVTVDGVPKEVWSVNGETSLGELEPYFQGDKTAQEAAALIQNRAQLYLDERCWKEKGKFHGTAE